LRLPWSTRIARLTGCSPNAGRKHWDGPRCRPAVVTLLAMLLLSVAGSFLAVTWQWQRARAAHRQSEADYRRARAAFRQAHRAVRAVQDVLHEADSHDRPRFQPLRKELLRTALHYYRAFLTEHGNDPSLRADIADASYHLACLSAEAGDNDEALRLYHEALPLWDALARAQAHVISHRHLLARRPSNPAAPPPPA